MKLLNLLKKETKYLIILLLFSNFVLAQNYRFYYLVEFKMDSLNVQKDITVLEINKDYNFFLSNEYLKIDSLNKANNNYDFPYPKFKEVIKWEKSSNKFRYFHNLSMNYYSYSSIRKFDWKIENETKNIGEFKVQKATTEYSGRKWIAWFSKDFNFNYGPYVFNGLPGLILEIYDENKEYKFLFFESKNLIEKVDTEKIVNSFIADQIIEIKETDWKKIQLNYYNNPLKEYINGEAYISDEDGTEYSIEKYRNLEKVIQSQLKKGNNPIELDTKVDYK